MDEKIFDMKICNILKNNVFKFLRQNLPIFRHRFFMEMLKTFKNLLLQKCYAVLYFYFFFMLKLILPNLYQSYYKNSTLTISIFTQNYEEL